MSQSCLQRTRATSYVAMLVSKSMCNNWSPRTLLLRFVEKNGISTVFRVEGDAIPSYGNLELWRIYTQQIQGRCVKKANVDKNFGVKNYLEVRMKFPNKVELSKESWPLELPYCFEEWEKLNQVSPDSLSLIHI